MTEEERENQPAYVGRCPHGNVGMLAVDKDDPRSKRELAKEIAACVRAGWTIERTTVRATRTLGFGCAECNKERDAKRKRKKSAPQQEALL